MYCLVVHLLHFRGGHAAFVPTFEAPEGWPERDSWFWATFGCDTASVPSEMCSYVCAGRKREFGRVRLRAGGGTGDPLFTPPLGM
jgi:hypothetical protein